MGPKCLFHLVPKAVNAIKLNILISPLYLSTVIDTIIYCLRFSLNIESIVLLCSQSTILRHDISESFNRERPVHCVLYGIHTRIKGPLSLDLRLCFFLTLVFLNAIGYCSEFMLCYAFKTFLFYVFLKKKKKKKLKTPEFHFIYNYSKD